MFARVSRLVPVIAQHCAALHRIPQHSAAFRSIPQHSARPRTCQPLIHHCCVLTLPCLSPRLLRTESSGGGSCRRSIMLAWCSTIVGLSLPEGMGTPWRAAGPLGPSAGSSIPPVAPHLHDRVLKVKLHSAVLKFARGNDALLPPDMQQDRRDGFALGTRAGLEKAYHVRRRPG